MAQNVGAITFNTNQVLGRGSSSIVYRGLFGKREVAVKRVEKKNMKLIDKEISLLEKADRHVNIIRYLHAEEDPQYYYIALELCLCSLKDFVTRNDLKAKISQKTIIEQMISGMKWLHSNELSIIHRDIKPTNVLLMHKIDELEVKISDFGFAKQLQVPDSQMSVVPDESNYWTVPEMAHGKYTKKSDVYSMGCLMAYLATNGMLPAANDLVKFARGSSNIDTSDGVLLKHLIRVMTRELPEDRPAFECIQHHPYFWDLTKILNFLIQVADRVKFGDGLANVAKQHFQEGVEVVIGSNWCDRLEPIVIMSLAYRSANHNYGTMSISELLRALRNKAAHYDEMPAAAKAVFGPSPDGFSAYWTGKFPFLLLHIYLKVYKSGLYRDANFAQFYPLSQNCDNVRSAN